MVSLTDEQAYAAMYYFLDQWFFQSGNGELGGLLGEMSLLPDGKPVVSSISESWKEAVQYALNGDKAGDLKLRK